MQRRRFCRYTVLGTVALASSLSQNITAMSAEVQSTKSRHQWVVLYWMPYDNNLSHFGEPITEMLVRATKDSSVVVAIQSDYWGDSEMRRRQLADGGVYELSVSGEDSSDVSSLSSYLHWAHQKFEADHWAVIVVGHGGKINEVSPDDHRVIPEEPTTWMGVDEFTAAIADFNQAISDRVELLFFQNCNKATLEVIYEARNCSRYTLASQLNLGAPNYYYEEFLNRLTDSSATGYDAALAIINAERADMYHSLTLVDNQAVKRLSEILSPAVRALLDSNLSDVILPNLPTYWYFDEQHCDAIALLEHLASVAGRGKDEVSEFAEFLQSDVIVEHRTGGELYHPLSREASYTGLCGLSLYLPENKEAALRYRNLALYQEVDLLNLYQGIVGGV